MNVKLTNPVKSISQQPERYVIQKSPSFVWDQRNTSPQHCSIPLYFNCLGGNWEGQIQQLNAGSLELRIQGFPPVKARQEIQFQCFGKKPAFLARLENGVIQGTLALRNRPVATPFQFLVWKYVVRVPIPLRNCVMSAPFEFHVRNERKEFNC